MSLHQHSHSWPILLLTLKLSRAAGWCIRSSWLNVMSLHTRTGSVCETRYDESAVGQPMPSVWAASGGQRCCWHIKSYAGACLTLLYTIYVWSIKQHWTSSKTLYKPLIMQHTGLEDRGLPFKVGRNLQQRDRWQHKQRNSGSQPWQSSYCAGPPQRD